MQRQVKLIVLKMLSLALISAGLAFFANRFGPRRIPWKQDWANHIEQLAKEDGVQVIPLFEVVRAFNEKSARFVDARNSAVFLKGHIPGAVNVPPDDTEALLLLMEEEGLLVVYCDGQTCDDALNLCRELKANGLENFRLFADGIEAWQRFNQPLETGAGQ